RPRSAVGRGEPAIMRHPVSLSLLVAATLVFSSTFPTAAHAQTISFVARRDFPLGSQPTSVALGDFDGDGRLDLTVANADSHNVSVLLTNTPAALTTGRGSPASP